MHCERARDALLERLDAPLGETDADALEEHLACCAECRTLCDDIQGFQAQARVWHELSPPPWNPTPAVPRGGAASPWQALVFRWFPPVASAAALLLAVTLFLQGEGAADAPRPGAAAPAVSGTAADDEPVAELLAATREERQQEMEALTALLKAEMDRRSLETEQSLKYVISHQIQSQRQLDAIRSRLEPERPTAPEQL